MSLFQQRVYWANYCLINGPVFSDIITLSNNWNIVVVLTVCDYQICFRFQKLDRTILCLRQSCGIEKQNGPQGSMADRSPTGDTTYTKLNSFIQNTVLESHNAYIFVAFTSCQKSCSLAGALQCTRVLGMLYSLHKLEWIEDTNAQSLSSAPSFLIPQHQRSSIKAITENLAKVVLFLSCGFNWVLYDFKQFLM